MPPAVGDNFQLEAAVDADEVLGEEPAELGPLSPLEVFSDVEAFSADFSAVLDDDPFLPEAPDSRLSVR